MPSFLPTRAAALRSSSTLPISIKLCMKTAGSKSRPRKHLLRSVKPTVSKTQVADEQQQRSDVDHGGASKPTKGSLDIHKITLGSAFGLVGLALDAPDSFAVEGLSSVLVSSLVLAEMSPDTAALLIIVLKPLLAISSLLFITRIVMTWDPAIKDKEFPWSIAYIPTEPILGPTRKIIKPVNGVDISPIVLFAIVSFANEILVGPQGLLVLLSNKIG